MGLTIDNPIIGQFKDSLQVEEKSKATIEKYMRDIRAFAAFLERQPVTKDAAIRYKQHLSAHYAIATYMDQNKTVYFRSIWEMIKLVEEALNTVSEQEDSPGERFWQDEEQEPPGGRRD